MAGWAFFGLVVAAFVIFVVLFDDEGPRWGV